VKWDGAGQPGRVTAAGAGGGDNRHLATAGLAPPTDGAARAEDAPAERKVGLWMSSVGDQRQTAAAGTDLEPTATGTERPRGARNERRRAGL